MTVKYPNLLKRLYWFAVLAVIALLTCYTTQTKTDITSSFRHGHGVDLNVSRVTRHLKSTSNKTTTDGENESRGLNLVKPALPLTAPFAAKVKAEGPSSSNMIKNLSTSEIQKAINEKFEEFGLVPSSSDHTTQKKKNVLENSDFKEWMKFVQEKHGNDKDEAYLAMARTLLSYYDTKDLGEMMRACKDASINIIAYKFNNVRQEMWQQMGISVHDLFNRLDLVDSIETLKSPLLPTWVSYAKVMKEKPYDLLVTKLNDDLGLVSIVVSANTNGIGKDIIYGLSLALKNSWLEKKQSAEDIFLFLHLKEKRVDDFNGPLWNLWIGYVGMLGGDTIKRASSAFTVLKNAFPFDELWEFITKAKTVSYFDDYVKLWEEEYWSINGENAESVFRLLYLDTLEGDALFNSQELKTWASFVRNRRPKDDKIMFQTFIKGKTASSTSSGLSNLESELKKTWASLLRDRRPDDDKIMFQTFRKGKTASSTSSGLSYLESKLLGMWKDKGISVEDAFERLELDKNPTLFDSVLMGTWVLYVGMLNKNGFECLGNVLGGDFGRATIVLVKANLKGINGDIVSYMRYEMLMWWRKNCKTVDEVSSILKLQEINDKSDPLFEILNQYNDLISKRGYGKQSLHSL